MNNYGFQKDKEEDPKDYIYGSGQLPQEKLCPSRDWFDYLPEYEPQFGVGWDPHNCTVHAVLNAIETIYKRRYNKAINLSERYNTILAKIRPPGATPKQACESVRKYGVVGELVLPMTESYDEYLKPDPMDEIMLSLGENFLTEHDFGYEFLWKGKPTIEQRYQIIDEALKYSPIPLSVTAWHEGPDGDYRDLGQPNNHFCLCFATITVNNKLRLKVFDTYDHSVKVLDPDHYIEVAMRIYLDDAYYSSNNINKTDNWLVQIVKVFINWLYPKR